MYIYCINCGTHRFNNVDQLIATVIAKSSAECLYTLSCYLSNNSFSVYCDDSLQWSKDEDLFLDAISNAKVFALADKEQVSKVVYYEGP